MLTPPPECDDDNTPCFYPYPAKECEVIPFRSSRTKIVCVTAPIDKDAGWADVVVHNFGGGIHSLLSSCHLESYRTHHVPHRTHMSHNLVSGCAVIVGLNEQAGSRSQDRRRSKPGSRYRVSLTTQVQLSTAAQLSRSSSVGLFGVNTDGWYETLTRMDPGHNFKGHEWIQGNPDKIGCIFDFYSSSQTYSLLATLKPDDLKIKIGKIGCQVIDTKSLNTTSVTQANLAAETSACAANYELRASRYTRWKAMRIDDSSGWCAARTVTACYASTASGAEVMVVYAASAGLQHFLTNSFGTPRVVLKAKQSGCQGEEEEAFLNLAAIQIVAFGLEKQKKSVVWGIILEGTHTVSIS